MLLKMSQINLPYSKIANKHDRMYSLWSAQEKISSYNKRNIVFILFLLFEVLAFMSAPLNSLRNSWESSTLIGWEKNKSRKVSGHTGKDNRIMTIWELLRPICVLRCWPDDCSINWTRSVSYWPAGPEQTLLLDPADILTCCFFWPC